jgi:hypothetical protein
MRLAASLPLSLRIGVAIAVVRLLVFACGLYLIGNFADSRQIVGYFMLILNSVVELSLASLLVGKREAPGQFLTALFIVVTSLLLGYWWTRLRFRSRPT